MSKDEQIQKFIFDDNSGISTQLSFQFQVHAFINELIFSDYSALGLYEKNDDFLIIDKTNKMYKLYQSKTKDIAENYTTRERDINLAWLFKYSFLLVKWINFIPSDLTLPLRIRKKKLIFISNRHINLYQRQIDGLDNININDLDINKSKLKVTSELKDILDSPQNTILNSDNEYKLYSDAKPYINELLEYNEKENVELAAIKKDFDSHYLVPELEKDIDFEIATRSLHDKNKLNNSLFSLHDQILNLSKDLMKKEVLTEKDFITKGMLIGYVKRNSEDSPLRSRVDKFVKRIILNKDSIDPMISYITKNEINIEQELIFSEADVDKTLSQYGGVFNIELETYASHIQNEVLKIRENNQKDDGIELIVTSEGKRLIVDYLIEKINDNSITVEKAIVIYLKGIN